jgi:hypothetical protein
MNKARLLRLAAFLEYEVPAERFDLSRWSNSRKIMMGECGSVGCAIGWATVLYRDEGLNLIKEFVYGITYPIHVVSGTDCHGEPYTITYEGWDAVSIFFDITFKQSMYLFYIESYKPPYSMANVIKRIREFVHAGQVQEDTSL